ncbi:MAG: hypothetical protein D6683_18030, partial [Actinomyces sp.]
MRLGEIMSRAQHELVTTAAAFADGGEWRREGATSAAHWIAEHLDVAVATAREWIRVGRALRSFPIFDEAFASRRLSYAKVRILT